MVYFLAILVAWGKLQWKMNASIPKKFEVITAGLDLFMFEMEWIYTVTYYFREITAVVLKAVKTVLPTMMDNDARTARTYAFAAFWVQAALFVVGAFLLSVALVYWIFGVDIGLFGLLGMAGMVNTWTLSLTLGQTLYLVAAIALTASAVWLVADYYKIYRRLREEKVARAERSALWFGIVQTIVGGTVAGLLLLYAYVKIRRSEIKTQRAQATV